MELGINPSILPQHFVDSTARDVALNRLRAEGLSPLMRRLGDALDDIGVKIEKLEKSGRAGLMQIRQPIPDQDDCGDCVQFQSQKDGAQAIFEVTCGAALFFPAMVPLCEAAAATYLTYYLAWSACQLYVTICQSW